MVWAPHVQAGCLVEGHEWLGVEAGEQLVCLEEEVENLGAVGWRVAVRKELLKCLCLE